VRDVARTKRTKKGQKPRVYRSAARSSDALAPALHRLGRRVLNLRLQLGLTQEALAERAELDAKYVMVIEKGRVNTTMATLVALARGLKVSLADLFSGL
jgi:DNA-binding XRE family transcriptional regulator